LEGAEFGKIGEKPEMRGGTFTAESSGGGVRTPLRGVVKGSFIGGERREGVLRGGDGPPSGQTVQEMS